MSRLVGLVPLAAAVLAAGAAGAFDPGLVDPTRPPGAVHSGSADAGEPVGAAGAVVLDSVFLRGERRFAVIGGERVEVGDRVTGAQVVAIDLWGVRLRDDSGDWILKLTGEFVPVGVGNEK